MSNTPESALSASTASFLTSLAVNGAIAGGELVAFIFARRWIKAVYEPRTYIPIREEQAVVLGKNLLAPLWKIITASPEEILHKNGVDPYVFVRFLMMMAKAMIPIWLLSWAVLIPVNAANTRSEGKNGLDRLTFGNINTNSQARYWAHLILDYIFIAWILYLVWVEMDHWLIIRQKHLISPTHSKMPQANTVLVTGIPKVYMDEEKLAQLYSRLPGGVKRIWLVRDLKEMPGLWERRSTAAAKLESAQVQLIRLAKQHQMDTEKKIAKLQKKNKPIPESLTGPVNPQLFEERKASNQSSAEVNEGEESSRNRGVDEEGKILELADQLVPRAKRPSFRVKPSWAPFGLGFLGIGKKEDTILWAKKEIAEIEPQLAASRQQLIKDTQTEGIGEETYPPLSSAFIHFNQQIAAHMAVQCLAHNQPYRMNGRYIEQSAGNVIWNNLSHGAYENNLRQALSYAATTGLVIAWTFPVAFIGILSNVATLTETFTWLEWIQGDSFGKKLLQGVISGVLPPILLALLMLLLPTVLRRIATAEGLPSKTEVELTVMTRYFIFLVIHTFFVVTLSSGLVASIKPIAENPSSVATILARQMPTASTFFITLILTQFTGTAGTLLQPISLAFYYIRVILGGGTPRSIYKSRYRLGTSDWGTQFPQVTVYAVISCLIAIVVIGYMVISPVINGFGALFFLLAALVWKYIFIWVQDEPAAKDTGGSFFPKAITHVFVGIYIQEVCLCALFFLPKGDSGLKTLPQAILMIVLIVLTAAFQYVLLNSYKPLRTALPISLAHLSAGMEKEAGHEDSIIGHDDEMARQQSNNQSKEHLTSQAQPMAQPNSPIQNGKRSEDSAPTMTNNGFAEKSLQHMDDRALGTSVGPPLGTTHSHLSSVQGGPMERTQNGDEAEIEMGTIGQEPDPSNENDNDEETAYFAVPGGPGVRRKLEIDGDDPNAFFHPATKEPLRIVWLPKDELGLCEAEMEANVSAGIQTVNRNAVINALGKVQISGMPPDDF